VSEIKEVANKFRRKKILSLNDQKNGQEFSADLSMHDTAPRRYLGIECRSLGICWDEVEFPV
jgi:hypothetical protein